MGRTGKYWAWGPYVMTTSQEFSVGIAQTQSITILTYDHWVMFEPKEDAAIIYTRGERAGLQTKRLYD